MDYSGVGLWSLAHGLSATRPDSCESEDCTTYSVYHIERVTVTSFHERAARFKERWRGTPEDPPSRWLRRHWPWLSLLALACLAVFTFDMWLGTCGFAGCPTPAEIRAFHPSEGGNIYDRNQRLIGHLANVRRVNVPISAVPKHVQDAFIATEDRRFYQHNGLDWRGVLRATARNLSAGGIRQGFSTITMQVAHNSFLQDRYNGRSLRRKLIELRMSRLLERELTKQQILEHYLNVIYLGNGVHGVEAASRDLFGKSVDKLTVAEGALLAALPKAPSTYTPRKNPTRALKRRNLVLGLMADQGYIGQGQKQAAVATPLRISPNEWRPSIASEPSALDAVRAIVDSVAPDILKDGDVNVYTTLDFNLQRAADRTMLRHMTEITRETRATLGRPPEEIQGALVAMDPSTGDIRALVPGRRTLRGGFNRAFSARRQPGSAFKPFVYAAALAAGYSPAAEVDDDPLQIMMGPNDVWQPANYNDTYAGRVTFARALMLSANAATVRVSRTVGERAVIAAARRNGITSPLRPVPSIALGAEAVTPLELVTAYAPFANGGMRVQPRLVTRVEAPDGTLIWSTETQRGPAMDAMDAYEITQMLQGVVNYGTARAIRDYGITGPVAGKTGTTNSGEDVWFVGYTPSLVAGIWFGYDQPRPISANASGGRLAVPAWAEMYQAGWREPRNASFTPPPGMVAVMVDPQSGEIAGPWCPARTRQLFKPGKEPQEECHVHAGPPEPQIPLDGSGNLNERTDPLTRVGRDIGRILRRIIRW